MAVLLREVTCRCGVVFYLCSACDRGHRYCSDDCRQAAREWSRRRARRKYACSERGRQNNRDRQRRFRQRHRKQQRISQKRNGSLFPSRTRCDVLAVCLKRSRPPQHSVAGSPDPGSSGHPWKFRERPARKAPPRHGSATGFPTAMRAARLSGPRCHLCGRVGRVVRQRHRRGRFRWSARGPPGG